MKGVRYIMCEYCKGTINKNEPILKNQYWDICIDNNDKELVIYSDFEAQHVGYLNINFCPMCGEKLKKLR
jgi:hypothetical protein